MLDAEGLRQFAEDHPASAASAKCTVAASVTGAAPAALGPLRVISGLLFAVAARASWETRSKPCSAPPARYPSGPAQREQCQSDFEPVANPARFAETYRNVPCNESHV